MGEQLATRGVALQLSSCLSTLDSLESSRITFVLNETFGLIKAEDGSEGKDKLISSMNELLLVSKIVSLDSHQMK
jgi:hypothetical protein